MERDLIIKALECCYDNNLSCIDCPFVEADKFFECSNLTISALSLIKELTKENERLINAGFDTVDYAIDKIKQERADTVRKMQERLKQAICDNTYPDFNKDGKPVNVWNAKTGYDLIDQIAKEIIGEEK